MTDYKMFDLGDVVLQCKKTLRDVKLAYKTFGTLNAAKDNVIVYPTWYSGQHYGGHENGQWHGHVPRFYQADLCGERESIEERNHGQRAHPHAISAKW